MLATVAVAVAVAAAGHVRADQDQQYIEQNCLPKAPDTRANILHIKTRLRLDALIDAAPLTAVLIDTAQQRGIKFCIAPIDLLDYSFNPYSDTPAFYFPEQTSDDHLQKSVKAISDTLAQHAVDFPIDELRPADAMLLVRVGHIWASMNEMIAHEQLRRRPESTMSTWLDDSHLSPELLTAMEQLKDAPIEQLSGSGTLALRQQLFRTMAGDEDNLQLNVDGISYIYSERFLPYLQRRGFPAALKTLSDQQIYAISEGFSEELNPTHYENMAEELGLDAFSEEQHQQLEALQSLFEEHNASLGRQTGR